jgi:[ribosomal protein S5]-alanine N-acetyltransferase
VRRSVRSTVAQHPGESAIQIRTNRLKIVPATVALARAELGDRLEFARQLDAAIPENWPPESAADALPLFGWYGLALEDTGSRILVAGGGFLGPPQAGSVQLGYSVLPQYQGRGYATELVNALIEWAREQPGLERIVAETEWANPASARVLQKAGFVEVGSIEGSEGSRFELRADKR